MIITLFEVECRCFDEKDIYWAFSLYSFNLTIDNVWILYYFYLSLLLFKSSINIQYN